MPALKIARAANDVRAFVVRAAGAQAPAQNDTAVLEDQITIEAGDQAHDKPARPAAQLLWLANTATRNRSLGPDTDPAA